MKSRTRTEIKGEKPTHARYSCRVKFARCAPGATNNRAFRKYKKSFSRRPCVRVIGSASPFSEIEGAGKAGHRPVPMVRVQQEARGRTTGSAENAGGLIGRRNTPELEIAMAIRRKRSTRARLGSEGRPPVAGRLNRNHFAGDCERLSSEDAALEVGVPPDAGYRLFRKAGGMPPSIFRPASKPLSGRYLSFANARRSRFSICKAIRCRRSGAGWAGPLRPFPANSIAMRPPTAARWPIGRRPLSGMPIAQPVAPNRRSLPITPPCGLMWKNGFPVWSRCQTKRVAVLIGRAIGHQRRARFGHGRRPGAPSKLPYACRSTFRMTRRCASAPRLFIRPFSFKAVELSAVN